MKIEDRRSKIVARSRGRAMVSESFLFLTAIFHLLSSALALGQPTNQPAATTLSLALSTNGAVTGPTNFWSANNIATNNAPYLFYGQTNSLFPIGKALVAGTNMFIDVGATNVTISASASGGGGAPTNATYITQTADAGLSAEQAMSALGTGLVKNTTGTGVLSIGVAGTDFQSPGAYITALTGDVTASGPGSVAATIAANSVALTTDTTGNYVVDVVGTANEITLTHTPAEGSTATVSLPTEIDLGGKTSFEIPNAAAPTVDAFGELAGDNDLWAASRGAPVFFDGTAAVGLLGALVSDAPSNGQVPTWNTGGTITWETPGGGGAPTTSQYLTLAADAGLSAERILTGTANQIILTDSGADAALTLSTPQNIGTASTPQFAKIGLNVAADADNKLKVNTAALADTLAEVLITPSAATQKALVLHGAASQSAVIFQIKTSAGTQLIAVASDGRTDFGATGGTSASSAAIQMISTGAFQISTDTKSFRDGSNIWAHRNGSSAQTLRVYGTYTDASNYERAGINTISGASVELAASTAGTGADNLNVLITPAGTGGVVINGGTAIKKVLSASAALDFDLTAVVSHDLTITVTGAADGDTVSVGAPNGSVTADTVFFGWVSAADTVTIRATRNAGTPNPASGTFRATVTKF